MEITDILIGNGKVRVETEDEVLEYPRRDDGSVDGDNYDIPSEVEAALRDEGLEVTSKFPQTVTIYAHDEASPYDYEEIGSDLGMDEDSSLVQRIASQTYEISMTIRVEGPETAVVTKVNNWELKEPQGI